MVDYSPRYQRPPLKAYSLKCPCPSSRDKKTGLPMEPHPQGGRLGMLAYANAPQVHRSGASFPSAHRRYPKDRLAAGRGDQLDEIKAMELRLTAEPSPRHPGAALGTLQISHDRGLVRAVETGASAFTLDTASGNAWLQCASSCAGGWSSIGSLPRDHLEHASRRHEAKLFSDGPCGGSLVKAMQDRGIREDWEQRASPPGCGIGAIAQSFRRRDERLHEELAPAPVHPCGPDGCFPTEYVPRRGVGRPAGGHLGVPLDGQGPC